MKKIFIYVLCFLMTGINVGYASTSFENPPKLINSTNNSLSITWDNIDSATGYYVYYSENSGKNPKSFGDVFEGTSANITGLKASTTYYVVVTYIDKTSNDESDFSPEGTFNTKISSEEKFAISEVNVINSTNLEFKFNQEIDNSKDAVRQFKITKNGKDITDIKEIKLNEENNKILNIELNSQLDLGEYKLTVLNLTDSKGRNIEEGINGEIKFIVDNSHINVSAGNLNVSTNGNNVDVNAGSLNVSTNGNNVDVNAGDLNVTTDGNDVDLNSGDPENQNDNYGLAGKSMTGVLDSGEVVGANSNKLPKTGPESMLLVFASFVLGLFYFRKRKTI